MKYFVESIIDEKNSEVLEVKSFIYDENSDTVTITINETDGHEYTCVLHKSEFNSIFTNCKEKTSWIRVNNKIFERISFEKKVSMINDTPESNLSKRTLSKTVEFLKIENNELRNKIESLKSEIIYLRSQKMQFNNEPDRNTVICKKHFPIKNNSVEHDNDFIF